MGPTSKKTQPHSPAAENIEDEIALIGAKSTAELQAQWQKVFGSDVPPAFSKDLLARAISYRLQEMVLGGLGATTARILRSASKSGGEPARHVKVGSVIVREYKRMLHEVLVVPGGFCWQGNTYDSLSAVARKITGISWNGPRFFGLRSKKESDFQDGTEVSEPIGAKDKSNKRPGRRSSVTRRSSVGVTASGGGLA